MIRALRGRLRRPVTAFPAAALALALSCAGLLAAQPANAADGLPDPGVNTQRQTAPEPTASDQVLHSRVIKAAEKAATPRTAKATPFIIGGSETTIAGAPWMVQLAYYDDTTGDGYFCGGTLVSPSKVLTAAHCVAGLDWQKNGAVLAGTTDLYDSTTGTVAGVWGQWNHPKYSASAIQNDFAVLTLAERRGRLQGRQVVVVTAMLGVVSLTLATLAESGLI